MRPTGVSQAIGIVLATFAIAALHSVTPLRYQHWHDAFQHLYFFPVVYAALCFGWRGGVAASALAALVQVVHIRETWVPQHTYAVGQILEIPLLFAAGLLCGLLVERERRQREELARTTRQLNEVYLQLQQNFDQMKRAERLYAVGQLAAGLAHEIRNPLASISGASGILQRTARLEDQQAKVLAVIDKECQRLTRLLSDFLDFARPRPPKFQAVDVNATVVQPVIELAMHAIRNRNLSLRREKEPDLPIIECDPDQLRQLLLNLIINAIQATGEGEVLVSAAREDDKMLLRVKDQGCGIPEENREKVFDPFFTTKEGGTGLGLSVAHQIVEQHGGVLTTESNPGGGMTFTARLPVRHKAFS